MKLQGIFKKADVKLEYYPHIYPKKIFAKAVKKYVKEYVDKGIALGELDHPPSNKAGFNVVNLQNVSHQVIELHWEDNILYGTIEIFDTPTGKIVKQLLKEGAPLGISSRGVGSVNKKGIVKKDYELICFDIVYHRYHLLTEV